MASMNAEEYLIFSDDHATNGTPPPSARVRSKFLFAGMVITLGCVGAIRFLHDDSAGLSPRDLARAKQVVPGLAFKAAHANLSNALLNKHLSRLTGGKAMPCESMSMHELVATNRKLRALTHPGLAKIYAVNVHPVWGKDWKDPRGIEGAHVSALLEDSSEEYAKDALKEKACYDAAMSFTHSVTDADKSKLLKRSDVQIPLLPVRTAEETNAFLRLAMTLTQTRRFRPKKKVRRLADAGAGESVFNTNCAPCHAGGHNFVAPERTLHKSDMETYLTGGFEKQNVMGQVTNGKNAMPMFGEKLSPEEIDDVAAYVMKQANQGWE